MITVLIKDCNTFSKNFYNIAISRIPLHMVKCTCGKSGCLIRYGFYPRKVKWMSELIDINIQRVYCNECGHTNALLLSSMVPYSRIPLKDQQDIIDRCENHLSIQDILNRNFLIDESNVKYVLSQYRKHWKQRLLSIGVTLKDTLTIPCFSSYSRQFMQIHRTRNILFLCPT